MHKLIQKANGLDIDSLLKMLGARSIYIKSGACAKQEQNDRGFDDEDCHKNWWCEISWGSCSDYDSHEDRWIDVDGVDFASCASGDSSKEVILSCIEIFIRKWFRTQDGFSDEDKGMIIKQGFDPELLK
jgi:hypothetical protein